MITAFAGSAVAEEINDQGYAVLNGETPGIDYTMPNGLKLNRHQVHGKVYPENPKSPLINASERCYTSIIYKPENPEDGPTVDTLIYQHAICEFIDPDGDMILMYGVYDPPARPTLTVTETTGKFEGLTGTVHWSWTDLEHIDAPPGWPQDLGAINKWEGTFNWDRKE
jgi:hypothetical protein